MDLTRLYDYQLKTAHDLAGRVFGADLSETGTGKTITALAVMNIIEAKTILIVSPKSVAEQWERKAREFWAGLEVHRIDGARKEREQQLKRYARARARATAPIALIVTYEQVRSDIGILSEMEFQIIYADESHRLGNPATKLYRAFRKLRSERRFCSTATPLRSSPLQAWGIFNWLHSGILGSFLTFKHEYCIIINRNWIKGYKNLDHLGARLKPYYIKNKMEDVGVFLPPIIEVDINFELGAIERRLYDNIVKEMLLEISKQQISKIENPTNLYNSVVKLGKLQELTDSLELLGDLPDGRSVDCTKLNTLKEHLKDTAVGDNKVVVFTRFSRMADILFRELQEYNPALITGAVKDRQGEIDKFDSVDSCKVIIITTAGNEGINLQRANILYMVDVPLGSYGSLVQTVGRINRIGQTKPMVVYYLLAKGTVDVKLKALLESKKDMAEKMFSSLQDVRNMLE